MKGDMTLELTSADIAGALAALTQNGIVLLNVIYVSELTVRLSVQRQDLPRIRRITERRGETLRQRTRLGVYWKYRNLVQHPLLIMGLVLLLSLTVWLPTRVLFIQVQGNHSIPTRLVLEKAAQCGISFGADRGTVRSEKIKNALLDALPQLQWAGINTSGCVAVITVEERRTQASPEDGFPGSIVAARDGVITDVTAVRGTALCRVGQAVRAGEILISGYMDCGGVILNSGAAGEIYGETKRKITAVTPKETAVRREMASAQTKFALIIGKNRINFYQDSGILDTSCVKMYSEYYMTLPGGFQLPIILVREQWQFYDCAGEEMAADATESILADYTRSYLQAQMIAGKILQQQEIAAGNVLYANYVCLEMIGQIRYEEITNHYGENYGENG